MSGCYIACRSLTYAQRTARYLERAGFTAIVRRLPSKLSENGCGYAVKISRSHLDACITYLKEEGLSPKKVFAVFEDGSHTVLPV
jgi:hypothetical protein